MQLLWYVIVNKGELNEVFTRDESDIDELCRVYDLDFERLLEFVEELPYDPNRILLDIDTMHKNNFGRYKNMTEARHLDIRYITEKPVQVQAVKVTRDNIYYVAEWVGARTLFTPIRKNVRLGDHVEPRFALPDGDVLHYRAEREVTVGHWVVRDKDGRFSHMSETEFKRRYDDWTCSHGCTASCQDCGCHN